MIIVDRYRIHDPAEVIAIDLPIEEHDRQRMVKDILQIEDQQNRTTNVNADMSSWKLWNEINLNPLLDHLFPIIQQTNIIPWNIPPVGLTNTPCAFIDMWSAVYRKGDSTKPHNHIPATGSFVYYPQANPGSAPLVFNRSQENTSIHPKNNTLIIFPGHVYHSVPELEEDEERIVIAGNWVRLPLTDRLIRDQEVLTYGEQ